MDVYIYIYTHREREREIEMCYPSKHTMFLLKHNTDETDRQTATAQDVTKLNKHKKEHALLLQQLGHRAAADNRDQVQGDALV